MESSEHQEPSYYEVALTNRQVLIAFVALLTCLLVAFLSGVWIGRGGGEEARAVAPLESQAAKSEPPLEQLSFFNGSAEPAPAARPTTPAAPKPAESASAKPPASPVPAAAAATSAPEPDASDAMRENLEAAMAANRESPAMKMAVGERTGTATGATNPAPPAGATAPAAPPKPATPATAASAVKGKIFVQVYSSNNGKRAREIVDLLRKAGFQVVISELPRAGGRNFRVRVGPFTTRADADAAAIRLRRDHRLDTWVTDSP